ncbi:putative RNA-directed DNA polymerase from transposon BS [Varanus komodoensis]|nr:putative RNA-directed DNA polymerase from transposon BS [Varanus komodoensis]
MARASSVVAAPQSSLPAASPPSWMWVAVEGLAGHQLPPAFCFALNTAAVALSAKEEAPDQHCIPAWQGGMAAAGPSRGVGESWPGCGALDGGWLWITIPDGESSTSGSGLQEAKLGSRSWLKKLAVSLYSKSKTSRQNNQNSINIEALLGIGGYDLCDFMAFVKNKLSNIWHLKAEEESAPLFHQVTGLLFNFSVEKHADELKQAWLSLLYQFSVLSSGNFRVVWGLVQPGPKKDPVPPSITLCDNFVQHFKEKVAQICHELDSPRDSDSLEEVPMLPSGHILLDEFQLLRPDDVDKVLGQVRTSTCLLDPCPSWLLFKAKDGIGSWILEVINASLKDDRVPAPLKEAVVRPVLKKASLDPEMATNYRPVANIPFLGKVLEQVVAGQHQALLDETDYLDPFSLASDPAAFDTIDHGILLDRLRGLGVGGTAWQWFCSYLNSRFQKVVLGDFTSAPWQLCHGVPQESILSPLLFNIYMKPLGEVIRRCGLWSHQYADDTQFYLSFSTNPGEAVAVLNWCLAKVMGWMRANKLKLNPDKTEVLLMGGSNCWVGDLDLVLNGVALPLKDRVRSLRVLLNPELTLEAQVLAVARSAFLQLRLIHQLHPYLEDNCLVTVTHALVTSWLDFCNMLYVGLPLKTVRILQMVQNRAVRLLTGTGRYSHITPVLHQLHWFPIEVRAQFKVLIITYKALNSLGPGYLKEHLRPYLPARPLRSAAEALLREPSVREVRRPSTRRRAFSVVAPHLWNALPREVCLALSLFVFRRQAKTFLFKQYFNHV